MGCAAPGAAKVGHLGKPGNKADRPQSPVPSGCDNAIRVGTSQRFLSSLMHFASTWAKLPRVARL
jgi:hypothetical protein